MHQSFIEDSALESENWAKLNLKNEEYQNCKKEQLFVKNVEKYGHLKVLDVTAPATLHTFLGTFKVQYKVMIELWPESEQWSVRGQVIPRKYFGGSEDRSTFDGKQIRKLLAPKRFTHLEDIAEETPHELALLFIRSFTTLRNVIDRVLGNNLDKDWEILLNQYEACVRKLEEKATLKLPNQTIKFNFIFKHHSLFEHIPYYAHKYGALGKYNEQALESAHHQWNVRTGNYFIDIKKPDFGVIFTVGITWNSRNGF